MKIALNILKRLARLMTIVLLVVIGSTALVRFAPGYLSDEREMDARYAGASRNELSAEAAQSKSLPQMLTREVSGWLRGNLGRSRQYEVPVSELIAPRLAVTASLLMRAIPSAWALAFAAAFFASITKHRSPLFQISFFHIPAALLLAAPTAALATVCLMADSGGPVLVMTLLLAARDFKFIDRILRKAWLEPYLLQARAQGISTIRLLWAHILPSIRSQMLALVTLSVVTALSAVIPIEVIFNIPGLGQLAWNAAMNRDLPVLLAITVGIAIAVSLAGLVSESSEDLQAAELEAA